MTVPAALEISSVGAFASDLRAALDAAAVELDAEAVSRVDAVGVQLLLSFLDAARGRGVHVAWGRTSPTLLRAARTLGLASRLGLDTSPRQSED